MGLDSEAPPTEARREFLKQCGKFAALTPPAVTFLLSTSLSSKAIAASGGHNSHLGPPLGIIAATGGAGVAVAAGVPHEQVAAEQVVVAEPPPAPVMAPPPPPPPPQSEVMSTGERG